MSVTLVLCATLPVSKETREGQHWETAVVRPEKGAILTEIGLDSGLVVERVHQQILSILKLLEN